MTERKENLGDEKRNYESLTEDGWKRKRKQQSNQEEKKAAD